jgi:glycosyltransferase involved in cell wall biosynthesis
MPRDPVTDETERTVLHVRIASGTGGGPEKTILNSPRYLRGSGYRGVVIYLHPPGDEGFAVIEERARAKECPLLGIPERLPIDPVVLWKLAFFCRREKVRIWHGHDYKSNLYGVLLRPFLRFDLVTTVHGWVKHTSKTPLYYGIDRWTLPRHHRVIAVSSDLRDRCLEGGVPRERLTLIENAIDTEEFRRGEPTRTSGTLRIGAAGRLSEEKGFGLLIEAVERLIAAGRDIELAIAGEGDQESALREKIASSPHRDRLHLLGFRSDTVQLFQSFDIYCLSSLREGLPNVVLEAMAMEVPVVATRSGGMETFARDGVDSVLIDPGSVDELERGLSQVIGDAELRGKLAANARERMEEEFSFGKRMERVVEVYDGLGG